MELADLLEERGDLVGAAEALERAIQVYPFEIAVHVRLAGLYAELDERGGAVRERRVVVALEPADRTGALFELAEALYRAGDTEGAREAVLGALELAPRFPEAQELLLRIMSEGTGGNG
jgi:tetratricopeptide (TPR) repeat protein